MEIEFAKIGSSIYLFGMSMWIAILCSAGILGFSIMLLRLSGVWNNIFAPLRLQPKESFDPLSTAPVGWIENHAFWDNHPEIDDNSALESVDFWEDDSRRFAS